MIKEGTVSNPEKDVWNKRKSMEPQKPKDLSDQDRAWIASRIQEHEKFRSSPVGRTALSIAEKQMQYLLGMLSLPIIELAAQMKVPFDLIHEYRAELRGQYTVWAKILGEPETLFALQRRYKNTEKSS
jgi:hypothetical protein